jgi:ABC-type oligopeptide transport system substrate-binding subunit
MKNKLIIIAIFTVLASCLMTACQTSTTAGNNLAVNPSANKTPANTNRENVNSAANQTKTVLVLISKTLEISRIPEPLTVILIIKDFLSGK